MTDEQRLRETVAKALAESHKNDPTCERTMAEYREDATVAIASIVDVEGITWHHAENARRVAHNFFAVDRHIMEETARILLTLLNASKGADDA